MPIISTTKAVRILEILVIAWKEGFALWLPSLLPTPTHIKQLVLLHTCLQSRTRTSAYQSSRPDIRTFPVLVPQHVKEEMITVDRLYLQMEVPALLMEKLLLDMVWFHDLSLEGFISCLVPSSPPRLILLFQVPGLTLITPLKWLLWLRHCLSSDPLARLPGMSSRAFIIILCMLLVFAWARSRLVHMCSWHSHVNGPWYSLNANFDSPCNTCTVTVEIWVMNVLTMPLHVGPSALPLTTMLPPAGFIT